MAAKDVKKKLEKDLKLKTNAIPAGLINLFAAHQVLSDVTSADDAEEVEWACKNAAGVFKAKELEKIFATIVGSLLQKDRKSCNTWASSMPTRDLDFILEDNPTVQNLPSRDHNVFISKRIEYVKGSKVCVAIAIVARDVQERWDKFSVEDKQFVTGVMDRLGKSPHFNGVKCRALWDRLGCRYIVVDCLGSDQLAQCPRWVLNACFDAPWRGPGKQASFIYLFQSYSERGDAKAAAAVVSYLSQAHTDPDSELKSAAKDFIEDPDVPAACKSDFLIAFISACRRMKGNLQSAKQTFANLGKTKKTKEDEVYQDPDTKGWELLGLEHCIRQYSSRPAGSGLDAHGDDAALGDMLQAVLLLSSESLLHEWAKDTEANDPATIEVVQSLLKLVAGKHLARMMQTATRSSNGSFKYDDAKAQGLIKGALWMSAPDVLYSKQKERPAEDIGQLLRMYVKFDLAIKGGGLWSFMQTLEGEDAKCHATNFSKIAPMGSALQKAVADDIRSSYGNDLINEISISRLLDYVWFFNPAFQRFLKAALSSPCAEGTEPDHMLDVLEATVKVLSLTGKTTKHPPQEMMSETWEPCRRLSTTLRFMRIISKEVIGSSWEQNNSAFDLKSLRDCAKELSKAGLILHSKLRRGVTPKLAEAVEGAVGSMVRQNAPLEWTKTFRSLDTVIFALEYMEKEDLKIAYQHFEEELQKHERSKELLDLLKCVQQIYTEPLATASLASNTQDGQVGDMIRNKPFRMERPVSWHGAKFGAQEWKMILKIAASAAEVMKQRYNVLMLPHHTQMIVVLMFAIRACRTGAQQVGYGQLPKTFLGRVGTGEGKSMVIGMLASFVALKGLRAHVVNDDFVLTQRDYALNQKLFEKIGIRASCDPRDLKNNEVKIVYCTGNDVEESLVNCLTQEGVEAFETNLQSTVLIVDEVDGLILDKGVITEKLFFDATLSDAANKAFSQLMTKGSIMSQTDDFRAQGEFPGMADLEAEVQAADRQAMEKKEGVHFSTRGDEVYMLNPKTKQIDQEGWSLWLEVKRAQRQGGTGRIRYKAVKAVLSRIQCFMSYACIFGVTGSLGQKAEQKYLSEHYEAVSFNVPYFLDTCRNDSGGVQGKSIPKHIAKKTPYPGTREQEAAVVQLAMEKCLDVPVLVIAEDPEAVKRICAAVETSLKSRDADAPIIEDEQRVIPLLHNPREPEAFVELVDLSTEPLKLVEDKKEDGNKAKAEQAAPAPQKKHQRWRITVTTAEGGRGHDYRVIDPAIDEAGGLLLILTWVPWSEREWIQFLGRTGRQDHIGQYATMLNAQDPKIKSIKWTEKDGDKLIQMIMAKGDAETAKVLQGNEEKIKVGKLMHRLTAKFWSLAKREKTTPFMDWDWKVLCETYSSMDRDSIKDRFETAITIEEDENEDPEAEDEQLADEAADSVLNRMSEVGPSPSSVPLTATPPPRLGPKEYGSTFIIRKIDFYGKTRKVLMHSGGGSSLLQAICNILLLREQLQLDGGRDGTVKVEDLLMQMSNAMLDLNFTNVQGQDDGQQQADLTEGLEVLQQLNSFHELHMKFEDISSFEDDRVFTVFPLLDARLVHGWVASLGDDAYEVIANMSSREAWHISERFDVLQKNVASGKSFSTNADLKQLLEDIEIMEKAPGVRGFLHKYPTELTDEGLNQLKAEVKELELVVLLRRGEFMAVLKVEDDLYALLTDANMYLDTRVVWVRISVDEKDTCYTDSKFSDAAQRRHRRKRREGGSLPQPRAEMVSETRAKLKCPKCSKINQFPVPAPGAPWPKVRCGHCGDAARPLPPAGHGQQPAAAAQ